MKELIIDGTGLLFINTTTDLQYRNRNIKKDKNDIFRIIYTSM